MHKPNDYSVRAGPLIAAFVFGLATLVAGAAASLITMLFSMACDECGAAEAEQFDGDFRRGVLVFLLGLLAAAAMMLTGWFLMLRRRSRPWVAVLLTALAPLPVVSSFLAWHTLIDWPG